MIGIKRLLIVATGVTNHELPLPLPPPHHHHNRVMVGGMAAVTCSLGFTFSEASKFNTR
jgi:hypothetical protein